MYFGGKSRISKPLSSFLNEYLQEGQTFLDMFCGSCNVVSKIRGGRVRIANDKHEYLISMWKGVQEGYTLPDNITKEQYEAIRKDTSDKVLHGFVGFGLSFAGKWWGGYARGGEGRNYCQNAKNSTLRKMETLKDVLFSNKDYKEVVIPSGSLVYCDIPYKNTTQYSKKEVGDFCHQEFYEWCKVKESEGVTVLVSEYLQNVPEDARVIFSVNSKKDIRNKDGEQAPTTEVVFRFKSGGV